MSSSSSHLERPFDPASSAGAQVLRPRDPDELWARVSRPAPVDPTTPHIGEALVKAGLVSADDVRRALVAQRGLTPHRQLGEILVAAHVLTDAQLRAGLARWLGIPVVDALALPPTAPALAAVPRAVAERELVLPLMRRGEALVVALSEPWDQHLLDELRFMTQLRIVPVMAAPGTLLPAIDRAYRDAAAPPAVRAADGRSRSAEELAAELGSADAPADDLAPVAADPDNVLVRFVHALIEEAIRRRASDIHIETGEPPRPVRIRLRIDGDLVPYLELPAKYRYAVVARLKIMSDLDISEHRKPQDGKIDFARFGGSPMELRVVTVPTAHGLEDVVLRLLTGAQPLPLEDIGLSEANLAALRQVVAKAYGLVLVCGPTGCGKTTTLHSVLRELNEDKRKIWTAEDPIEITQEGLRQVQVNPRIGWTFAAAMRTFLRADPDVIMIGEMRDEETARIAIEASLTGHLVLSTLHTNSAPESIARLLEIGLDPFNFADSLLAILAQRLVRRLCTHCRLAEEAGADALHELAGHHLRSGGHAPDDASRQRLIEQWRARFAGHEGRLKLWRRRGCAECDGDGYRGRLGIHELMVADDEIRKHVRHRAPASQIQAAALATGMKTLRQDGIEKVLAGLTDLGEVLAATNG